MSVGVPDTAVLAGPEVQWNHIDGPLIIWAGMLHWLTVPERLGVWLRLTTVERIAARRWPRLAAIRAHLQARHA